VPSSGGPRRLYAELGPVNRGETRYLQCFASGFGKDKRYCQICNLGYYQGLAFTLRNTSRVLLQAALQIKDYRDSTDHHATYRFEVPTNSVPLAKDVALPPGGGWSITGEPDLGRVITIDFVFEPQEAIASGPVYLDELALQELGEAVDVATSSLPALVERLAHRQWDALWSARNRATGMIPNTSYQASDVALNTTAVVLWTLPAAARPWGSQCATADPVSPRSNSSGPRASS
jgi:hypothetical protein